MSVIIRLQGLPWTASAGDIRQFFAGLNIPDGGVHIVGGEQGDAFIAFTSDEDARLAMQHNNGYLQDAPVQLFLSSKTEMQHVISEARDGHSVKTVAPPHTNVPPGERPNLPRHMDDFPRQDMIDRGRDNQRRPPNAPPFGPRGPRDEPRFPSDIGGRGMRGEPRPPQDVSPGNFRGNRDDQRHPVDPPIAPRGNRDTTRLSPNAVTPGQRGQRDNYRPNFPPGHREYIEEPRQGGPPQRRPTNSPHFRDSQIPDNRMGPQSGLPMYRDGPRPQSDFSGPNPRSFRDEHRQGHDRHRPGDQRELRQPAVDRHPSDSPYPSTEGAREGQRRPPNQPRFDPNAPDQLFDPSRPNQRLDPNAPGARYDPNLSRLRDFREEGGHGPLIPPDGLRNPRNDSLRQPRNDGPRQQRGEYQGDRRGPDGQLPRRMRESDRHMPQVSGPRDGRNLPPPAARAGSDPSELHVLNRRGYMDEEHLHAETNPAEPPSHAMSLRGGQRPPLDAPEQVPHNYRDQDRRGPPPPRRFAEDGRPLSDRRRPDLQGPGHRPPAPRDRVPPGRTSSQGGGFPQDHDARIPHRYDENPERQFPDYAEPYVEKERQFDDPQPFNEAYGVQPGRSLLDWDGRPPVNRSLAPQVGPHSDRSRDLPRDQSGQRPYEQTDTSRFPHRPGGRTLLPDPDMPRMDPAAFKERQEDRFHSNMESRDSYDHREGQFNAGYEDVYSGQAEMTEHHLNDREPYPPRGRPHGPPPGRHMPPRQEMLPVNPHEMCVRVTNLPLSVTYSSLRRFFERSMIPRDGVKLLNDNQGNRIGSGYLKFVNSIGLENALVMNGKFMEDRSVGVTRCSQEEFESAIDSYTPPSRALSPKRHFSDRGYTEGEVPSPKRKRSESPSGRRSGQVRKSRYIALLRDVPFRASPQDLKLFFNQLEIVDNGILFDRDSSGKPNGVAFVEFKNSKDFNLALQRNHSRFMNRSIIISAGDVKDYERALDKRRRSGGSNGTRFVPNEGAGDDKAPKTEKSTDKDLTTPKKESPQKTVTASSVNISCFCVRLKGLPPTVTKKNVEDFFKGLDIAPKGYFPVSKKDGSCTGDAFVEFVSPKECQKACAKDQQSMGSRTISVQPVSKAAMTKDLQELRKKAAEESPAPVQPQRPPPLYFMLGAQNLPFSVSIGEILNFFRGYNPVPESIRLHYTNEGRPTGDAVIGFMTESECHRALRDLNARMLGRRNIRLYLA